MASWLGYSTTTFVHAPTTVNLPLKKEGSTRPLSSLCSSVTPPCNLNPLLFNGHAQTIRAAVTKAEAPVHYRRHVFISDSVPYPGQFAVDFVSRVPASADTPTVLPRTTNYTNEEWQIVERGSSDRRPMLLLMHGIGGGSHETYVRLAIQAFIENSEAGSSKPSEGQTLDEDKLWVQEGGAADSEATNVQTDPDAWEALVLNARGCAKSEITSPRMFNARATWDVRQLVKWLRKTYPNRPIFALGFSLGANILVNYLGEEGSACEVKAAVVCSNPWNLEAGSLALQRSWIGLEVYSKALKSSMNKLFEIHVDQFSKDPRLDIERIRKTKYLHDFDRYLQGPVWGYPTEGAYYRDASSTESILAVRIPLFALHAEDDPIAPPEALPIEEAKLNPWVVMCNTSMGGHLGWFEIGGGRWFVRPVAQFLKTVASEVDFNALDGRRRVESDNNAKAVAKVKRPVFNAMRRRLDVPL